MKVIVTTMCDHNPGCSYCKKFIETKEVGIIQPCIGVDDLWAARVTVVFPSHIGPLNFDVEKLEVVED